jgi:hypothetical protein
MKFVIVLTLIVSSLSVSMLRKKKTGQAVCVKINADFASISCYPTDCQGTNTAVRVKAIEQLTSARKLLNNPGSVAIDELAAMGTVLKEIAEDLKWEGVPRTTAQGKPVAFNGNELTKELQAKNVLLNRDFNRQIFPKGAWGVYSEDLSRTRQILAIGRVGLKTGNAMEIGGMIGIIGDIGTALVDYTDASLAADKKALFGEVVKTFIAKYPNTTVRSKADLTTQLNLMSTKITKERGGTPITRGKKKVERGNCLTAADGRELGLRKGLMNLGEEVDAIILGKAGEILPAIWWPWQTVPNRLIICANNEPWAGHVSGSIGEILYVMDLLKWSATLDAGGEADPMLSYSGSSATPTQLNVATRRARAALAAAMLISYGYHSATEVAYTIHAYLGTPWRPKAAADLVADPNVETTDEWCTEDNTTYISNLMKEHTR